MFDRAPAASVASHKLPLRAAARRNRPERTVDINDDAKEIVQELGNAINLAVERSTEVAETIERLRAAGFELELVLKLEIGLREREEADGPVEDGADDAALLELTDEDRRTLRSMRIRFDDPD